MPNRSETEREFITGATVRVSEVLAYLDHDRLMSKAELADFLDVSERWVTGRLNQIPHFRIGREIRFRLSEIIQWLESFRAIGTTIDLDAIGEQARTRQKWAVKRVKA